jgi:hypothetical protein
LQSIPGACAPELRRRWQSVRAFIAFPMTVNARFDSVSLHFKSSRSNCACARPAPVAISTSITQTNSHPTDRIDDLIATSSRRAQAAQGSRTDDASVRRVDSTSVSPLRILRTARSAAVEAAPGANGAHAL